MEGGGELGSTGKLSPGLRAEVPLPRKTGGNVTTADYQPALAAA